MKTKPEPPKYDMKVGWLEVVVLLLLAALAALILTGCGTTTVYVPRYVLETPPDALLLDCRASPPPDAKQYVASSWNDKEDMLTKSLTDNYGVIQTCNVGKSELREWKKEQILIYETKNKEAKTGSK